MDHTSELQSTGTVPWLHKWRLPSCSVLSWTMGPLFEMGPLFDRRLDSFQLLQTIFSWSFLGLLGGKWHTQVYLSGNSLEWSDQLKSIGLKLSPNVPPCVLTNNTRAHLADPFIHHVALLSFHLLRWLCKSPLGASGNSQRPFLSKRLLFVAGAGEEGVTVSAHGH
jgi:hypothetical protein